MRYKITITTPEKETAEEVHRILAKSKIYNSSKVIMHLSDIKEVCEECAHD
jgi:hypothetical protein